MNCLLFVPNRLMLSALAIGLLWCLPLRAQVDSLVSALQTATPQDRPVILNQLCWELRNLDAERARDYGMDAIAAAQAVDDDANLIKAYSFTGVAYRNMGYYPEALEYYTLGLKLALEVDDRAQQGYGYNNLANLYLILGEPETSLKYLENLEDIAEELDDPTILGYMYLNFGRTQLELGLYAHALQDLQKSLAVRQETGNRHGQSVCKKYIGDVYLQMEDYTAAQRAYEEGIALMDFVHDQALFSAALNGLARALMQLDQWERARGFAERSQEVARDVSLLRAKEATETLSEIARHEGNYRQVEQYLQEVIAYNDQLFSEDLSLQAERYNFQLKTAEIGYEREKQALQFAADRKRLLVINVAVIVGIVLLLIGGTWLSIQRRRGKLQREYVALVSAQNEELEARVEARSQELQQKNADIQLLMEKEKQLLQEQLDHKERELSILAMHGQEKQVLLSDLLTDLKTLSAKEGIAKSRLYKRVEDKVSEALKQDDSDEKFMMHFKGVHPQFFTALQEHCDTLTANEQKLCAYIKLGMSNKEVAEMLSVELGTVKSNINRLKKKLQLTAEDSFRQFVGALG